MRQLTFIACLALGAAACSDIDEYCEALMKCEGGNDADVNACIEFLEADQAAAEEYGCEDDWEAQFNCVASESSCQADNNGNEYTTRVAGAPDPCEDEENALNACIARGSTLDDN